MKTCEFCGEAFDKRRDEYPHQYKQRRTCSSLCSRRLIAQKNRASVVKKVELRTCSQCGVAFMQKRAGQEMCSRKCARRKAVVCMAAKTAGAVGWIIADTETGSAYIDRAYETEALAIAERHDLLRGYPDGHEWRERLVVRRIGERKEAA